MATNNSTNTTLAGQTGTGTFAGSTSPTFVTPVLGAASATSINFGGSTLSTYTARTAWTPAITFVTPGDLSVAYTTQVGFYVRVGDMVSLGFVIVAALTYTTASGSVNITGIPFASNSTANNYAEGSCRLGTVAFPTGTTSASLEIIPNSSVIVINGSGASTAATQFSVTQFVSSASSRTIVGSIVYFV